jgi:hypothetical protein
MLFQNRLLRTACTRCGSFPESRTPPINEDSVELDVLDDGADNQSVPTWLQDEVWVITLVEGNRDLRRLRVLGGGRPYCHDLLGCKLLLPLRLVGVGPAEDIVNLLTSFREVTLWVFGLFILFRLFDRLQNLVRKTLPTVAALSLVEGPEKATRGGV